MRYPQDNQGHPGERVDYTYHSLLTLNSALDMAYDPAGRIVRRRLGTPGTIVAQYSYNPWNVQGGLAHTAHATDDRDGSFLAGLQRLPQLIFN